jgi:hypothetical protein
VSDFHRCDAFSEGPAAILSGGSRGGQPRFALRRPPRMASADGWRGKRRVSPAGQGFLQIYAFSDRGKLTKISCCCGHPKAAPGSRHGQDARVLRRRRNALLHRETIGISFRDKGSATAFLLSLSLEYRAADRRKAAGRMLELACTSAEAESLVARAFKVALETNDRLIE